MICIALPSEHTAFDEVNTNTLRDWIPTLHYAVNPQHLSIESGLRGNTSLRHRFIPSSKGSIPIIAAADLEPAKMFELQQSILFETGFDWGGTRETGKIGFGLGGGSNPSGGSLESDGFTARLIWEGNNDGTAKLGAYVYSADRSHNLPYGDVFLVDGFEIPIGVWLDITLVVTMNSSVDKSDGSLAIWINDEVRLSRENIRWQGSGQEPMIDSLLLSSFYGGNTSEWSPDYTTFARVGNVCYDGF